MDAASLIRSVRRRQGLTQAELARRAATSQPVVSAYERGLRDPSCETLRRLVEAGGERLRLVAEPMEPGVTPAAGDAEHARRLVDVLSLADAVPVARRPALLEAPRMVSHRRC